jgi:hypothetical protein
MGVEVEPLSVDRLTFVDASTRLGMAGCAVSPSVVFVSAVNETFFLSFDGLSDLFGWESVSEVRWFSSLKRRFLLRGSSSEWVDVPLRLEVPLLFTELASSFAYFSLNPNLFHAGTCESFIMQLDGWPAC